MTIESNGGIFRELEPPPGGTKRFEERLDRLDRSPGMRVGTAVAAGLAVCILTIVAIGILRQPDAIEADAPNVYEAQAFDRLLGRTREQAPIRVSIDDAPVSISALPSADSKIRIYEIAGD